MGDYQNYCSFLQPLHLNNLPLEYSLLVMYLGIRFCNCTNKSIKKKHRSKNEQKKGDIEQLILIKHGIKAENEVIDSNP